MEAKSFQDRLEDALDSTQMIALNRARTTFQRIEDAKFFNGWVRRLTPASLVVQVSLCTPFELWEEFSFQVYGNRKNALFRATLVAIRKIGSGAAMGQTDGTAQLFELEFQVTTKLQFSDSAEEPRFTVEGVTADIERIGGARETDVKVLDVGPGGLAVISGPGLSRGDQVSVTLYGYGEAVRFDAEVRGRIPYVPSPGYLRIGLQIKEIDRLNAARWKRFFSEVVERNRASWAPDAEAPALSLRSKF